MIQFKAVKILTENALMQIYHLQQEAFREEARWTGKASLFQPQTISELRKDDCQYLLCYEAETIIAALAYTMNVSENFIRIEKLMVANRFFRKKIGSQLVAIIEDMFKGQAGSIRTQMDMSNSPALAFYQNWGMSIKNVKIMDKGRVELVTLQKQLK